MLVKKATGLKKTCPHCASNDVVANETGGGICNACGKPVKEFKELRWHEVREFKRDLVQIARYKRFSWRHCDETHAFFFILLLAVIIVVFILVSGM